MRSVPDDDVLVDDRLAVDEAIELRLGARRGMVVDLVRAMADGPEVALAVGVPGGGVVMRAGDDLVPAAGAVAYAPPALVRRVAHPFRLPREPLPLRTASERRVVELVDDVLRLRDVEVEAPVHVMVVDGAHARRAGRAKEEPRPDLAVRAQAPLADVAVPPRLELGDEHDVLAGDVHADAEEVADVGAGVENRLRRRRTEAEPRRDVGAVGMDHPLLPLPVAVRPALVAVVAHVEDRHVGLVEDAAPAVGDVAELDARAPVAGRGRRARRDEVPQERGAAANADAYGPRRPLVRRRLIGRGGNAANARGRERARGRAV